MPTVYNGIGTWYYGKANHYQYVGHCESCGRETTLHSYDTTKYFVLLFVPLIPLQKIRVIAKCNHCDKHKIASLKKWEAQKSQAIAECLQACEQKPEDAQAAIDLMAVHATFEEEGGFLDAAPGVAERFSQDANVLKVVGALYSNFGYPKEAQEMYLAALAIEEDPAIHEQLALVLIKQFEPAAAEEHLVHIYEEGLKEKVGFLLMLGKGYQAVGDHENALGVFEQAVGLAPELNLDKEHKKLVKLSEKNRNSNKEIRHESIQTTEGQIGSGSDFSGKLARFVMLGVFMAIVFGYLLVAHFKGTEREVYLVNGLDQSYTVSINHGSLHLPASSSKMITVSEGDILVEVQMEGKESPIQDQVIHIATPFWTRPFSKSVYVINPDQVALLVRERIFYVINPDNAPEGTQTLHVGRSLYQFEDIDYVFREYPDELDLPGGDPVSKDRIGLLDFGDDVSIPLVVQIIAAETGKTEAIAYAKRQLDYYPEKTSILSVLADLVDYDVFAEMIGPGLDVFPVRVEWHRIYQTLSENARPDHDLVSDYRHRLEQNANNTDLQYLLARIVRDSKLSEKLFEQAGNANPPNAYALHGLAYQKWSLGDFDQAATFADKALTIMPENAGFQYNSCRILMAAGRYDASNKIVGALLDDQPDDATWIPFELQNVLLSSGYPTARQAMDDRMRKLEESYDPNSLDFLKKSIAMGLAYCAGQWDDYESALSPTEDPAEKIARDITLGRPLQEQWIAKLADMDDPYPYLLVYLAEQRSQQTEKADGYLEMAVQRLLKASWEEQLLAQYLSGERTLDLDKACNLTMECGNKAILLTALGLRHPQHQEMLFALARKLNYYRDYPYWFLKSLHETP
jgi:tetratricopeptide (TPR) repeat protein